MHFVGGAFPVQGATLHNLQLKCGHSRPTAWYHTLGSVLCASAACSIPPDLCGAIVPAQVCEWMREPTNQAVLTAANSGLVVECATLQHCGVVAWAVPGANTTTTRRGPGGCHAFPCGLYGAFGEGLSRVCPHCCCAMLRKHAQ